jgi:hypothetical protein
MLRKDHCGRDERKVQENDLVPILLKGRDGCDVFSLFDELG